MITPEEYMQEATEFIRNEEVPVEALREFIYGLAHAFGELLNSLIEEGDKGAHALVSLCFMNILACTIFGEKEFND